MKKNLKKVISAVIALALSVGSVAMAAPAFTDVAETAAYAESVNTLAALGVIAGYEDGTFKPENNITRAEVATMVVAALNRSADAEGAKGTTKFADMNTEAKAWATGYVNIGVTAGFISGYEDGTFKPDNNVTFAEMVSMLVRTAGYGRYAEYLGGWPNGYLSVGKDKGITNGVSAAADVAVTRGQVAQMIANTLLDVPTVEGTTLTTDANGNLIPEMSIMNGKNGNPYKTMLTEKHNAYYVEGHVSATNKSQIGNKLDADEVEFTIEYTENYDDSDVVIKKGETVVVNNQPVAKTSKETVYVGDTDAADYLFTYASAIIKIDENDDATLVSFIPSGKNDVQSFDATLIDNSDINVFSAETTVANKPYVRYYANKTASRSTKYTLNDNFEIFVNGKEVTRNATNFNKYVVNNTVGTVEFIDRYTAGNKADGDYDIISVTYYATAKVGAVNVNSGRVSFDDVTPSGVSYITLNEDVNEDVAYAIYYNGEEIDVAALEKGDILSISYDVGAGLDNTLFYDIYVSRDTAAGKYTSDDDDNSEVIIGGENYEFVKGYAERLSLEKGNEYTLYLDAFGRIFDYEIVVSSVKLAVIDRYTSSQVDDFMRAMLFTADGSAKNLEVDTTKYANIVINGATATSRADAESKIMALVYVNGDRNQGKNPIEDRVVEYKISASKGTVIELETAAIKKSASNENYKASSKAIGSLKMNDATNVIDALDYADVNNTNPSHKDLAVSSVAAFTDGGKYTAFAYGDKNPDGTYAFVILKDAGGNYTFETNFAVLTKTPNDSITDDGEEIFELEALYQGVAYANNDNDEEHNAFIVNDDANINGRANVSDLVKGDVIVFVQDSEGNIKAIDVIAKAEDLGFSSYAAASAKAFAVTTEFAVPGDSNNWTGKWNAQADQNIDMSNEVTQLVYGPIVGKEGKVFKLGQVANGAVAGTNYTGLYTNVDLDEKAADGSMEIFITDDTNVYVMNFNNTNTRTQLGIGVAADIMFTPIADAGYLADKSIIPWNAANKAGANFAFAKVVDGDATDVFVFLAE